MSMWTHVIGAIHIDTFKKLSNTIVEDILLGAPAITDCQVDITIEDGYNTFEGISEEYQTCAIVSLCGDSRDRRIDETKEEVAAFIEYLEKYFYIKNKSIKIMDDMEEIIQW